MQIKYDVEPYGDYLDKVHIRVDTEHSSFLYNKEYSTAEEIQEYLHKETQRLVRKVINKKWYY